MLVAISCVSSNNNNCQNYQIYQQGACNQTFLDFVRKTAFIACKATENGINQFESVIVNSITETGYSSFAIFNQTGLGFYFWYQQ